MEALLCGCEAICHKGSGVVEVTETRSGFAEWMEPLRDALGAEYVRVALPKGRPQDAGPAASAGVPVIS